MNIKVPSKSLVVKEGASFRTVVWYQLFRKDGCLESEISSLRDFVFDMKQ